MSELPSVLVGTPYSTALAPDISVTSGDIPGVVAVLPAPSSIYCAGAWGPQTVAWKLTADSTATLASLRFFAQDAAENYYSVEVDYAARTVRPYKRVTGVATALGAAVAVPTHALVPGVYDTVRVDALWSSAGTVVRCKVDGETLFEVVDAASAFTSGGVGLASLTGGDTLRCSMVEVLEIPGVTERVGLNP